MDKAAAFRSMFAVVFIASAMLVYGGWRHLEKRSEANDLALAARASQAIATQGARVVAMDADADRFLACGWADLGGADGATPVMAYADPNGPLTRPLVRVVAPRLQQGDLTARVTAAYDRQLVLVSCDRDLMPPRPVGAKGDDETMRALWESSSQVVIPAPVGAGFVAVRRKSGGGPIISPVFASREAANAWRY